MTDEFVVVSRTDKPFHDHGRRSSGCRTRARAHPRACLSQTPLGGSINACVFQRRPAINTPLFAINSPPRLEP